MMPLGTLIFAPEYFNAGTKPLGYPDYFAYTLIIFKALGAIAILLLRFPSKWKEWAYAGLTFNLVFAVISHLVVDKNITYVLSPIAVAAVLALSYISHHPACLSPGSAAVVYLELEFALVAGRPPGSLNHRFNYETTVAGKQESRTVDGPAVSVSPALAVTLGAPVNGGPWIAVSSPVWERGHRRVFYTQNGQARILGRFAIDFLLLDNQGKLAMCNAPSASYIQN